MDIKPIRTQADYEAALKEVENLFNAIPGTHEADKLDVLVTLIEVYEAKHYPIAEPDDPVEVLEYYLESRGVNRAALIPYLGSKERVSEVFNHKRRLSLDMIRRLHEGLGIPSDLLIASRTKSQAKNGNGAKGLQPQTVTGHTV